MVGIESVPVGTEGLVSLDWCHALMHMIACYMLIGHSDVLAFLRLYTLHLQASDSPEQQEIDIIITARVCVRSSKTEMAETV